MIKRISKFALAVFFISMFTPIVAPQVLEESEARAGKTTICHRTNSITNPYRRITVSTSSLNSGHKGHTGGIWTTSSTKTPKWGDIIPDSTAGGDDGTSLNFTGNSAGQAIWRGTTINPRTGAPVCQVMTLKQFYDSEIAAGEVAADIVDEIKDAKADEDLLLLKTLGYTFNTLSTSNLSAVVAASQAIVVSTTAPTSVGTSTATLNGSVKTNATALTCHFEYSTNSGFNPSSLEPSTATSVPINATTPRSVSLTGLLTTTKYFYRHVCHDTNNEDLYGETVSFTTGTTYTVTYDSNTADSGSVPNDYTLYSASETAPIRGNVGNLSKTGNTFSGWTDNVGGSDPIYSPSNTATIAMTSDRTLYAKWIAETYTVTFNGNGSTGGAVPSNQTKTYNVSLTLSGNTGSLQKTGHTFAGWNTASGGGGTSYLAGASYTANTGATMWAQWTADTYTVTYNGNGNDAGSAPGNQTKTYNVSLTLQSKPALLAKGSDTFAGWNTAANGTGTNYAEGASYTLNAGTTLYAKWTSASNWSVNYSGNGNDGGSAPGSQTITRGSPVVLETNTANLTLTGYTFSGWATQADGGGVNYLVGQTETPTANMNLYAKWIAETYTVTFNGNGSTGGAVPSNQTKTYNVSLTLSGNTGSLQKTGHTFAGWNTASGGGGTSYLAGASYTANTGATMWAQWTADTYTVTYNGNGNSGGSVPSDQTKTYDVSLTLQTNSGTLTKGTDTFAGWNTAANGTGTNYAEGASYTLNAGTTLYAKWTAASGGGSGGGSSGGGSSGGGNSANAATPARPTPAAVRKSATLVTLATTPVKSNVVSTPVTPSGATTPGNSGNTPASSGSTGGTTSAPGNSGNTPSSGVTTPATPSSPSTPAPGNSGTTPSTGGTTPATPTTPSPGNSGTTPAGGNTNERINVNNTQLSQTTAISTQAAQSVTFKGVGITQVNVVNNEVAVQARPGFSGKTTVSITVTSAEEVSTITADVIVIPLPVTNPVVRVVSEDRARIQWVRSPNAVTYEVTQNGRLLCTTSRTICTVTEPVSEATPVQIKALGRDQTESTVKQATYVDATIPRVIPEVALVVNFDTAKFNLDNEDRRLIREFAADVARFGFKEVDISGHTDSRGGIDNNVLSNNRAKSARAYLLSLLPNLKVTINGFADAINVAPNTTVEGLAANRRAEFRVVG